MVRRKRSRGGISKTLHLASQEFKTCSAVVTAHTSDHSMRKSIPHTMLLKANSCCDHLILIISRGIIQRLRYATVK